MILDRMKTRFCLLLVLCSHGMTAQVHENPFASRQDPGERVTYKNPVIPGFYSDPGVCRVGEDYYLVTSTFEYFPGVPVFHGRDLVHWEQIGHCIEREDQLPEGMNIFAATIRYNQGTFYMITTNVGLGGNFYVTATDPAGPWSDPVWIDVPGIDPDLFFDDDGKVYVISSPFILYEIDLQNGKLLTEGRKVWFGTGGRYSEGPRIYKKDGYYYLMAAEGGTEEAHCETIARSNTIWGPYTDNPANPILAHANAAGQNLAIQGVGHADIVQAHDGSWWMIFHGYRKSTGYPVHHILGRETCLAPVTWPRNGWPVVNGNGTATVNMTCRTLPLMPYPGKPGRDEFDGAGPGLAWNYLRVPENREKHYKFTGGKLALTGSAKRIGEEGSPVFMGRRLQHMDFEAITRIEFDPRNENEEAGMILLNNLQHFDLLVTRAGGRRVVVVKLQFGNIIYTSREIPLDKGPVELRIRGRDSKFTFSCSRGDEFVDLETVDSRYLSTETVGWFTGVYVGLYATGNGKDCKVPAFCDYFEYKGL